MVEKRQYEPKASLEHPDLGTEKAFFKIGEVAEIVGVAAYVLRYWESEFPSVAPEKSKSQQRVYCRRDVEQLLRIKHLLYNQKFTIAGAKQLLKDNTIGVQYAEAKEAYRLKQSLAVVRQKFDRLCRIARDDSQFDDKIADPMLYLRSRYQGRDDSNPPSE